jgi:hypothetical protein
VLSSSGSGVNPDTLIADAYLFQGGQFLSLQELESAVGTYSTSSGSSPTLTLTPTIGCNSATGASEPSDAGPSESLSFPFTVDANGALYLFPPDLTNVSVYIAVQSLCTEPSSVPQTPGDSLNCTVSNCGCSEAANGSADPAVCQMFQ